MEAQPQGKTKRQIKSALFNKVTLCVWVLCLNACLCTMHTFCFRCPKTRAIDGMSMCTLGISDPLDEQ